MMMFHFISQQCEVQRSYKFKKPPDQIGKASLVILLNVCANAYLSFIQS